MHRSRKTVSTHQFEGFEGDFEDVFNGVLYLRSAFVENEDPCKYRCKLQISLLFIPICFDTFPDNLKVILRGSSLSTLSRVS